MIPLWMARSGRFAGWHSADRFFDAEGRHAGYLAGHLVYALTGECLGEIRDPDWLGRRTGAAYPASDRHEKLPSVAHARLADRAGLGLADWDDPALA